eukprot:TRINITY_DN11209_c1_g1_i1.p1 TRINITY_DN11209_c1_g1~~TRINITY_DN11209_c1_g1_i1.p1  ORF type:complete len:425 (+),score=84.70 TRINITY_DN11209_c1_g1_i1:157-1431(+)
MPLRWQCCFSCCTTGGLCWDPTSMEQLNGSVEEIFSSLRTGDIIFFRGERFSSSALRVVIPGRAAFEHLGLIIRRNDEQAKAEGLEGLWLLEAVSGACTQFDPLPMKLFLSHHDFAYHVAVRYLRGFRRDAAFEARALEFAKRSENVLYSGPAALVRAGMLAPGAGRDRDPTSPSRAEAAEQAKLAQGYFCSSLVAHALQYLGLLRKDGVDWSCCIPSDFATAGGNCLLEKHMAQDAPGATGTVRYSRMYLIKWPGSPVARACSTTDFLSQAEAGRLFDASEEGEWDQEWLRKLLGDMYRPDLIANCRSGGMGVKSMGTMAALRLGASGAVGLTQPYGLNEEDAASAAAASSRWVGGAGSANFAASLRSPRLLRTYGTMSRVQPTPRDPQGPASLRSRPGGSEPISSSSRRQAPQHPPLPRAGE